VSLFDFQKARELSTQKFQSLVMAALMVGGERHRSRLIAAFPELAQELAARRESPNGRTPAESAFDEFEVPRRC
jgi:2-oxo-4-hydroxy-4-carboxy--5-ureidoimidazoline (OHCU) decarboxylase